MDNRNDQKTARGADGMGHNPLDNSRGITQDTGLSRTHHDHMWDARAVKGRTSCRDRAAEHTDDTRDAEHTHHHADSALPRILARLATALTLRGWHCATAESCTGGLVGALITDIPGSSLWYNGGVVSYSNLAKHEMLGVPKEALSTYGAVSEPVVRQMALGAAQAVHAQAAVSLSGVAGPGGGSADTPVGTVWIGLAIQGLASARRFLFNGNRDEVRCQAAITALLLLTEAIERTATDDGE